VTLQHLNMIKRIRFGPAPNVEPKLKHYRHQVGKSLVTPCAWAAAGALGKSNGERIEALRRAVQISMDQEHLRTVAAERAKKIQSWHSSSRENRVPRLEHCAREQPDEKLQRKSKRTGERAMSCRAHRRIKAEMNIGTGRLEKRTQQKENGARK
jgi:hypothetical protein